MNNNSTPYAQMTPDIIGSYFSTVKSTIAVALLPLILYRGIRWEIVCVNSAASIYRQQMTDLGPRQ
jgi:hypothetical protein